MEGRCAEVRNRVPPDGEHSLRLMQTDYPSGLPHPPAATTPTMTPDTIFAGRFCRRSKPARFASRMAIMALSLFPMRRGSAPPYSPKTDCISHRSRLTRCAGRHVGYRKSVSFGRATRNARLLESPCAGILRSAAEFCCKNVSRLPCSVIRAPPCTFADMDVIYIFRSQAASSGGS